MIYTTGTIAGSGNTITGTGTNFTAAGSLIRAGCTLIAFTNPVQVLQLAAITNGTSLSVTPAISPAIAAGTKYAILLSDSLSVDGLAQDIAETFGIYQRNMGGFADVMNGTGDVTITVDGKQVTVPGQKSLQKKDNTLTNLSGKDVAGLLTYLDLTDSDGRVGRLINVRVITTSGTYTPTAGTKSIVVEVQGAGGAGGAAGLVSGSNIAMGGGGAAGAYARSRLTAGFSGAQITIGAKGAGKNTDYSGKSGGHTSFGTITAEGGGGGRAVGAVPPFILTAVGGAIASGGSIVSITGASSLTGIALSASEVSSGPGGSSPLGSGGGSRSTTIAGDNASGFGSGGSGALNLPGAAGDLLGGDGSNGVVIVWEYA